MLRVRHHEFEKNLREILAAAKGQLRIGLRVGGEDQDPNIMIGSGPNSELWFVHVSQTNRRMDTWNLVGTITKVVMNRRPLDNNPLPRKIYTIYERAINGGGQGWVLLDIRNGRPTRARQVETL